MAKTKRKQATALCIPSTEVRDKFISLLKKDVLLDWDREALSQRQLAIDVLYLLGIAINEKKYGHYTGLREFTKDAGVELNLKKVEREDPDKT